MSWDPYWARELKLLEGGCWDGFDRRDDLRAGDEYDLGWIGENSDGVWLDRHPDFALLDYPELWPIIVEWSAGLRTPDQSTYMRLSAFHYSGLLVMANARARADARAMKGDSHGQS